MMNLILDLDGTLLDIAERYHAIYTKILKKHRYMPLDFKTYWNMKRDGIPNGEILLKGNCLLQEEVFRSCFAKLVERPEYLRLDKLQPGTKDFLQVLSEMDELMLVTLRKDRMTLLEQLRSLGIEKYFKNIVNDTTKDIKSAWQKKEHLFRTCFNTKYAVVIGDSEAEIRAGKVLGFTTIAISRGLRTEQVLEGYNPDYILSDINHVIPCLDGRKNLNKKTYRKLTRGGKYENLIC